MSLQDRPDAANSNLLLAALPHQTYERLISKMTLVQMPLGKVLCHAGDTLHHAYFLNNGMVSLISTTQSGSSIEVGMVGREGVVGLSIILGMGETPYEMNVQVEVESAWRISAEAFKEEFKRGGKFQEVLLNYMYVLLKQLSQSAVCNRFHTTEERFGRWLLIARDRVSSSTIHLTQEIIGQMLGIPRTGVTMTAGNFQREGLIRYSRGKITILDSDRLEARACECYEITKDSFDNYLNATHDNFHTP